MSIPGILRALLLGMACFLALAARGAEMQVVVEALLPKAAVLVIGGERKMLRVGQEHKGVALVAADAKQATLRINGLERVVGISQHIDTQFEGPTEQKVIIPRDKQMQYLTVASLNGRNVKVLVDTGANTVALNSVLARSMGIDFYRGKTATVQTASGLKNAYAITLQSVSVGGIEVNNVEAMVLEGNFPTTVLLGMSYLRHVKMEEQNGILSLSRMQ